MELPIMFKEARVRPSDCVLLLCTVFAAYQMIELTVNVETWYENQIIIPVAMIAIVVLLFNRENSTICFGISALLLLMLLISLLKHRTEYAISYITLTISYLLISHLSEKQFCVVSIACLVTLFPYMLYSFQSVLRNYAYIGNRATILCTAVMLVFLSCLGLLKAKQEIGIFLALFVFVYDALLQGRTAMIAAALSLLMILLSYFHSNISFRRRIIVGIALFIIGAIMLYASSSYIYDVLINKWSNYASAEGFESLSGRMPIWQDIYQHMQPLGIEERYLESFWSIGNAHNGFIQSAVMFGPVAFVAYCLLIFGTLWRLLTNIGNEKMASYAISYVPLLLLSFAESTFFLDPCYPLVGFVFFLITCRINIEYGNFKRNCLPTSRSFGRVHRV